MGHIVGPRNRCDLNASAHRCLMNTDCEGRSDVIWERRQTCTGHIVLDAVQRMLLHCIEYPLHRWAGKRPGENPQSHHTPPVTSANETHAPVSTEREMATRAHTAIGKFSSDKPAIRSELLNEPGLDAHDLTSQKAGRIDEMAPVA